MDQSTGNWVIEAFVKIDDISHKEKSQFFFKESSDINNKFIEILRKSQLKRKSDINRNSLITMQ